MTKANDQTNPNVEAPNPDSPIPDAADPWNPWTGEIEIW